MFNKHKDLLYTALGIGVIAGFIFITFKSEQPKPVKLEFTQQPQTEESALISEILADTESFATAEEAAIEDTRQKKSALDASVPLPVVGAPLPVAWDSASAPNLGETTLSPSLQRSIAASASLSADEYTDPSSELNLARVEELRTIRKNRHKTE